MVHVRGREHRITGSVLILDIDTDGYKSVSDSDVKAFLQMSQGIANPLMVQSLEKTRRNEVLWYALSFGAGVRQLSRLTGVSFGVIQKLTKWSLEPTPWSLEVNKGNTIINGTNGVTINDSFEVKNGASLEIRTN